MYASDLPHLVGYSRIWYGPGVGPCFDFNSFFVEFFVNIVVILVFACVFVRFLFVCSGLVFLSLSQFFLCF